MDQVQGSGSLIDVVHACAATAAHSDFFAEVLPKVRSLVGAQTIAVEVATPQGASIAYVDGLGVPPSGVEVPDDGSSTAVSVPASWQEMGVGHVAAVRLAGHTGVLLLGWETSADAEAAGTDLAAALDVVRLTSARMVAETELGDLVRRVDSAQHLASMGDYDWHIASDTNQWSDELYRIYGYEPQAFNASYERFLANIHPDDRERIQGIHQQAYSTGDPYRMIERIVRPDGELRYLSSNGEVIMDAGGTPVRMRGTCIDVTERVVAEQDRERVNERFRGLVEAAPEAILVIDAEEQIVLANPRAAEILGIDPTDRKLSEFLPGAGASGQATEARAEDGSALLLDVVPVALSETAHREMTAVFIADARPRLDREAMVTRFGEAQQRRRQALDLNDNVVQGLTSAAYALDQSDGAAARSFIERTLSSARHMMDDLLEPEGEQIRPGDLIRAQAASLEPQVPVDVLTSNEPVTSGTTRLPRVLIVDDAEDIRMLLRLKLSNHGEYEVVGEAADGMDAVKLARELQPDLVLLDMAMPLMDGLQALPLIREAVPDVRVIVLSGFNQATLEQEAIAAGADRYVVKGSSMRDLMTVIANVLQAA